MLRQYFPQGILTMFIHYNWSFTSGFTCGFLLLEVVYPTPSLVQFHLIIFATVLNSIKLCGVQCVCEMSGTLPFCSMQQQTIVLLAQATENNGFQNAAVLSWPL